MASTERETSYLARSLNELHVHVTTIEKIFSNWFSSRPTTFLIGTVLDVSKAFAFLMHLCCNVTEKISTHWSLGSWISFGSGTIARVKIHSTCRPCPFLIMQIGYRHTSISELLDYMYWIVFSI
jgi:hypothetical protein